jgi:hypothetical protein
MTEPTRERVKRWEIRRYRETGALLDLRRLHFPRLSGKDIFRAPQVRFRAKPLGFPSLEHDSSAPLRDSEIMKPS